jgi:dUTP pyrophosphatase
MPEARFARVLSEALIPTRNHKTDAGLDLYSAKNTIIRPTGVSIVPTGVIVEVPHGYVGQIWPKSRSNFLIGGGIVDEGYLGQIYVKVINPSNESVYIKEGDPCAQIVFVPCTCPVMVEVSEGDLKTTERGADGGIARQQENT